MIRLISKIIAIWLCGAGFANAATMSITFSGYTAGKETLTNFPAMVQLGTNIQGFLYSQFTSTSGWDLRFKSGSTELNYEIETWGVTGNNNSYVWVQIPLLTNGTVITASWGDATKIQQAYTTNGATWNSNYKGVWHLPNGTTLTVNDSTANKNHGVPLAGATIVATNGLVDGAAYFDGASGGIDVNYPSLNLTGDFTVSAWVKTVDTNALYEIFDNGMYSSGYMLFVSPGGKLKAQEWSGSWTSVDSVNTVTTGQWAYATATRVNGGTLTVYLNGQYDNSIASSGTIVFGALQKPVIGAFFVPPAYRPPTHGAVMKGLIDEFQVSSVAQSSNWVWACYQNMASNSVFNTYGPITIGRIPYYSNQLGYDNQQ